MFCFKCGQSLGDADKFCGNCGSSILKKELNDNLQNNVTSELTSVHKVENISKNIIELNKTSLSSSQDENIEKDIIIETKSTGSHEGNKSKRIATFLKLISIFAVILFLLYVIKYTSVADKDKVNDKVVTKENFNDKETGTVTDADGNVYHTVKIGNQVWTVENLRTTKYNDGTNIPNVTGKVEWSELSSGAYCYFYNYHNGSVANVDKYGALYNWHAVNTGKLAPSGWHVPTDAEWTVLENYLIANGYNWDGTTTDNKISKSLALVTKTDCKTSSKPGDIGCDLKNNNSSGFSALLGGFRYGNGLFNHIGINGSWWSATESSASLAYYRYLRYDSATLGRYDNYKTYGCSVRLLRD